MLDRLIGQHLEARRAAERLEARFEHVALLRYDVHGEVETHPGVSPQQAFAVRDQDLLNALAVAGGHLLDTGIEAARHLVCPAQKA